MYTKLLFDLLILNISLLAPPPTDGYAVIVWFHSGDFQYGSPSELDPFQIVLKQRVIIITVAYRLNIFGFFTSLDGEAPGNFGLMDQSASLLWIKKNIKLFGGNDTSITIMGQGSGAVSVSLHLTSGIWSEDNFHKAIIMSGSSFSDSSIRTAKSYTSSVDRLAKTFGCFRRPTNKMMECLRNLSPATLFTSNPIKDWGPIVDMNLSNSTMAFIRDFPSMMTAETSYLKNVPVMIGFTDSEEALDAPMGAMMDEGLSSDMFESLIQDMILNDLSEFESNDTCMGNNNIVLDAVNFIYKPFPPVKDNLMLRKKFVDFNTDRKYLSPTIQLATLLSKQSDTYVYRFDIKPKTPAAIDGLPAWIGVPHRFDLIFIWGMPYWVVLPDEVQWVNSDKRVTDIIMTLWMNFAKYTNPTEIGVYIKWDKFTIDSPGVLIVDRSFNMSDSDNFNYNSVQFWNDYYPRVVTFASQCCNSTNSGSELILRIPILLLPGFLLFYHKAINLST